MNSWQRWLQAPHTSGFRKLVFQIHLWLGIGLGAYVLLISLSGSAILLKSPFYTWFEPRYLVPGENTPLEGDALQARMEEVYAGFAVGFTVPPFEADRGTYVVLNRNGEYFPHYFNHYTGEDMGPANPWPIRSVEWLANLHDDLMLERVGRKINGLGGLLFILMSLSGILIWWQGSRRWHEGLRISGKSSRSLLWQLHAFIGFWSLLLIFSWGISGFHLGYPQYLNAVVDWLDRDPTDFERPNSWLQFFRSVHFARIGEGALVRWIWIFISFIPSLMLVTGVILWWKRVVKKRRPQSP